MSLFNELKRRNVLRVGAAYVVAAWLLIQVAETIFTLFGYDDIPARIVVIVLAPLPDGIVGNDRTIARI